MSKTIDERCDECGSRLYSGPPDCPLCYAPVCCLACCRADTVKRQAQHLIKKWREWGNDPDHPLCSPFDQLTSEVLMGCAGELAEIFEPKGPQQ